MNDDQNGDFLVNAFGGHFDLPNFKELLQLLDYNPRGLPLRLPHASHHRIGAENGQGAHHADDGFFHGHHLRNGADNFVFQMFFPRRVQKRNGDGFIQHADGKPQIDALCKRKRLAFDPV